VLGIEGVCVCVCVCVRVSVAIVQHHWLSVVLNKLLLKRPGFCLTCGAGQWQTHWHCSAWGAHIAFKQLHSQLT